MTNLPPIPIPQLTVESLTETLKAMRQYILAISGSTPAEHQPYSNALTRNTETTRVKQQPQWQEVHRVMEDVKVVNPQDPEIFAIMQLTKHLILKNSITGELWEYKK